MIQGRRWLLQHSCPGPGSAWGEQRRATTPGRSPGGCGDPPALGQALSLAAPCSVSTHQVWFPQSQLDLRGWREGKP